MSLQSRRRRTFVACLGVVALVVLALAAGAIATVPRSSGSYGAAGEVGAKQLIAGTITSFSPSSVVAGSGAFQLAMDLSSAQAAVPTWTASWTGATSGPLTVEASGTAWVRVTVPAPYVAAAGLADITVSDGTTEWVGQDYPVTPPPPHIDSLVPVSVAAGGAEFTLRVNGSNFETSPLSAIVKFNGQTLVAATPTGPLNPTAILYATVPAALIAQPQAGATITVVNPNFGGGVTSNAVTLPVTGPWLTGIEPGSGANTSTALAFVLRGTDLGLAGNPAVVFKGTGTNTATSISATGVAYVPSGLLGGQGTITGSVNLASVTTGATTTPAPAGKYDVVLTFNYSGSKSLKLSEGFEVTGPTLTSVSPATATNGATAQTVTLTGTGLNALATPVVTMKGPGTTGTTVVTATGVASAAPGTTMTCTFNLTSPTVAPVGLYDVIITYAGTKTLTKAQSFAITNAVPVVTTVSPSTAWAGSVKPTTLTVSGSGFVPAPPLAGAVGSKVQIGARLTADTTFVSGTQLTVPLTAADIVAAGTVSITVVNPTPGGGTSAAVPLSVSADTTTPITTVSGADTAWHKTPVTLAVSATDVQSGVQMTQWTKNGGVSTTLTGTTITVPAPAGGASDGVQTIKVWSTDWCNHAESPPVSVTVRIDTVGPVTFASAPSSVAKGSQITFKYRADDISPKCGIVLKVKTNSGSVKRTYDLGQKSSNKSYTYKVNPNLAKGSYKVYTYAKDLAGNQQSKLGKATFKVK
jgi:hypothetical protein